MNPTVSQAFIDAEMEKDPVAGAAEYLAQFRTDIEAYISSEAVDAVTDFSVFERQARSMATQEPKGTLYLNFLPPVNSGKVRLLGNKRLVSQLISLERSTASSGKDGIDHARGGNDDCANAVAGALAKRPQMRMGIIFFPDGRVHWKDEEPRQYSRLRIALP